MAGTLGPDSLRDRGAGRSSTAAPAADLVPWRPEKPDDEGGVTASDPMAMLVQSLRALAGAPPVYAPTKAQRQVYTWDTLAIVQEVALDFQCHQLSVANYTGSWVHERTTDSYFGPNTLRDVPIVVAGIRLRFELLAPPTLAQAGVSGQLVYIDMYSRWLLGPL